MRMTSSSLFSAILALSMFGVGAVADRISNVYVTNFPIDTQGNLRVSSSSNSQIITIFQDLPVSFNRSFPLYSSEPIEVGEFNEIYLHVSVKDWTTTWSPFYLQVVGRLRGTIDGITTCVPWESGDGVQISVTQLSLIEPANDSGRCLVSAPEVQVVIETYGDSPMGYSGSGHISVSLYLKG